MNVENGVLCGDTIFIETQIAITMGILKNGIFNDITGKVGNLISYKILGKTVVRTAGANTKAPSLKQLACRQEMAVVNTFTRSINLFINVSFKTAAKMANMYPQNKAVSYNKKHALKGVYPNIEMDYEKALVSMGNLPPLMLPEVEITLQGLNFTWNPNAWIPWPRCNDQVMLLAYFPEIVHEPNACFVLSGAKRSAGSDDLKLPAPLLGKTMEIYIAVVSDDRTQVSTSQYLGRLN